MQDAAQDLGLPSAVDQPDAAAHPADADAMPAEVPERDAPTDSCIALPARTANAAPCDATPEAAEEDVDSAHAAQMPQTLQAPVPAARTPDAARDSPSRAAPAAKMGAEEQSKAAGERADADEVPATTAAGAAGGTGSNAADGQDTACPAPADAVLETQPFVSYDIGAAEALETENSVAHLEDAENAAPVQASSAELSLQPSLMTWTRLTARQQAWRWLQQAPVKCMLWQAGRAHPCHPSNPRSHHRLHAHQSQTPAARCKPHQEVRQRWRHRGASVRAPKLHAFHSRWQLKGQGT